MAYLQWLKLSWHLIHSPALDGHTPPLNLHPHLCHIAALQLTMGEGLLIIEFENSTDQMFFLIYQLQPSMMTKEEGALLKLT